MDVKDCVLQEQENNCSLFVVKISSINWNGLGSGVIGIIV